MRNAARLRRQTVRLLFGLAAALCVAPATADLRDYAYDPDALPKPILEGREDWIELYYAAWDLAADNINFAKPGTGFVAEYMDEALTDNKIWQWDTLFIAMFAKYANGELPMMDGVDNFYRKQRSDGFICRELSENDGTDIYPGQSQFWPVSNPNPPLYSWAEWDYYQVTGDASRFTKRITSNRVDENPYAKTVVQRLHDYHFWIKNNIRHADGHYRSDGWANGMDDSPRNQGDNCGAWMDVAMQQALSALYLAKMAAVVGDDAMQRTMMDEYREHKELVNDSYWHDDDKLYYDLSPLTSDYGGECYDPHPERRVVKTKTVATFWPLIAEVASRRQADHLVHHLVDFNAFWRPMMVPTLAADQNGYSVTGEYWQGASWPPTTYMVARGLARQGYWPLVRAVAENYVNGLSALYQHTGTIWENNAPEIVAPSNDSIPHFVGWGGLGPIAMLIEHVLGIELNAPENAVAWRLGQAARNGVENLGFDGGRIARMVSAGRTNVDAPATIAIETTVPFTLTVWLGERSFTREIAAGPERTYRFGFDNKAPTANPNGPYRMEAGAEVAFSSAGSRDMDGRIASYLWDFGDGATSTGANPTHVYAAAGDYRVHLTVTDDGGASGRAQTFASSGEPEPAAAFYGDRIRLPHGGSVRFHDQSLHAPNQWRWSFPGGEPASSEERAPVVRYPTAGEYDVALTVCNAYGESEKSYASYVDVLGDVPKAYCYAASGSTNFTYISRVAVGPLDNRTGSDSYSLHDEPVPLEGGSTQTLLVVADVVTPVNNDRNLVRAWADWNGNRLFEDDEQLMNRAIAISDQPVQVSQSFTVPGDVTGIRRLRVKVNYDEGPLNDLGACQGFESGEVEDYEIEVIDPAAAGDGPRGRVQAASSRSQTRLRSGRLEAEPDAACVAIGDGEVEVEGEVDAGMVLPSRQQTLAPGGDRLLLNLRAMFPSDGEEPMAYSVQSDNNALAALEVADGQLRATSNEAGDTGVANVVVTAIFGDGRRETFSFVLTVGEETRSFLRGWRLVLLEDAEESSQ